MYILNVLKIIYIIFLKKIKINFNNNYIFFLIFYLNCNYYIF